MQLLNDSLLFLLPVIASAEAGHRRKYFVDVRSRGPYLPVPETTFDECLRLLRLEVLTVYDFFQVFILTLLNEVLSAFLYISIGIYTADKVLDKLFLAPELKA